MSTNHNYNSMTKRQVQQMAAQVTQMTANVNTRFANAMRVTARPRENIPSEWAQPPSDWAAERHQPGPPKTKGYCPRFGGPPPKTEGENTKSFAQVQLGRLEEAKNNLQQAKMALKMKDKAAFKERQLTKAASSKWAQSMTLNEQIRS